MSDVGDALLATIEGHAWHAQSRIPGLNYCQHEEHSEMTHGSPVCWKAQATESIRVDGRVVGEAGNSEAASAEGG